MGGRERMPRTMDFMIFKFGFWHSEANSVDNGFIKMDNWGGKFVCTFDEENSNKTKMSREEDSPQNLLSEWKNCHQFKAYILKLVASQNSLHCIQIWRLNNWPSKTYGNVKFNV